ncbi:DUF2478 domain-containing protein [Alcaligenes faecalis]|nr:DUF2478 domain-containing protein [Alcaligenes faecalis]
MNQKADRSSTLMDTPSTPVALAAIVHAGKGSADALLLEFIQALRAQHYRVYGLVQGPAIQKGDHSLRTVQDLDKGTLYPITQNLGTESSACRLDIGALLHASEVLRQALDSHADLVIVNRFGIMEADGQGFNDEILALIDKGYPVLTVVSHTHLPAWRAFTGGLAVELEPEHQALWNWFESSRQAA